MLTEATKEASTKLTKASKHIQQQFQKEAKHDSIKQTENGRIKKNTNIFWCFLVLSFGPLQSSGLCDLLDYLEAS